VKSGLNIKLVYTFGDQTQEQILTTLSAAGKGDFGFELSPPSSGYPVGEWKVEAFLNDVSDGVPLSFSNIE